MDESPSGIGMYSSQQVPMIGWDMESPNPVKVSPRSIILPRPNTTRNNDPSAGSYIIEQWGNSLRNKRRIRRPPRHRAHQSPVLPSATTPTAAKDDSDEFSDWGEDEDILAQMQIRHTPLANRQPEQSPSAAPGRQKQAFKTPTMFKTTTRSADDQVRALPRKLTAEFDNVKPGSSQIQPASSTASSTFSSNTVPHATNKQPIPTNTAQCDDDDLMSDEGDEELLRQADIYLASASQIERQASQAAAAAAKPTVNQSSSHQQPHTGQVTIENKENMDVSDSEMFDDSFIDEEELLCLEKKLLSQFETSGNKQVCRTPPRGNTPEKKKQRLSLSLKKKK